MQRLPAVTTIEEAKLGKVKSMENGRIIYPRVSGKRKGTLTGQFLQPNM